MVLLKIQGLPVVKNGVIVIMPREKYGRIQIKRANIGFYLQIVEAVRVGNSFIQPASGFGLINLPFVGGELTAKLSAQLHKHIITNICKTWFNP